MMAGAHGDANPFLFDTEAAAQENCPSDDVVVWWDMTTGECRKKGDSGYGTSERGGYVCRKKFRAAYMHFFVEQKSPPSDPKISRGRRRHPSAQLPGNLGRVLADTVDPGETLLSIMYANLGEGIVVTDQRVLILKAGQFAGAGFFGRKAISYYFDRISSVEHREGPLVGYIKVLAAGVLESSSANSRSSKLENVVTYGSSLRPKAREIASLISEKLREARSVIAPTPLAQHDIAEQLQKLAQLHSSGILSDAEFASAKARVLG